MERGQELFREHTDRLVAAITHGKPDRVPVVMSGDAVFARARGVKMADYVNDPIRAAQLHVEEILKLGDVDSNMIMIPGSYAFGALYLCNVKVPGRELPENDLWQVEEVGLMQESDYDAILARGWMPWYQEFLAEKLPVSAADFAQTQAIDFGKVMMMNVEAGIVPWCIVPTSTPFEILSMARGVAKFFRDLHRMPDKMEAVMKIMEVELNEMTRNTTLQTKPLTVFIGMSRGAGEFISPKLFERFVFPFLKQQVEVIADAGAFSYLHFDSNWTRDLSYFRDLPKGKAIFGTDHSTDIYKLKEILGGHICIAGDVPASMFVLSNPDEVYDYCRKIIRDIGPSGFVLAAGCSVPANAKFENVRAMVSAANEG